MGPSLTAQVFMPCPGWKETLEPAWSKAGKDSMWAHFEPGGNLWVLAGGWDVKKLLTKISPLTLFVGLLCHIGAFQLFVTVETRCRSLLK